MTSPVEPDLDAGSFRAWLAGMTAALRGEQDAVVPCDGCTACCRAAQFVLIGPHETDTITHIPEELLFPAPGRPGHFVLGYDERGHCPMLVDDRCSIYVHRPRTCRTYDCRVFVAAGAEVDGPGKEDLARRIARWRFRYEVPDDERGHDAVRAAAAYLRTHRAALPEGAVPTSSTPLAGLAVELHELFDSRRSAVEPDIRTVRVELTRRRPPRPS